MNLSKVILLIDDNYILLENTAEILALENFEVWSVGNGEEAIDLLHKQTPDMILCDIMMPGMNGYEFLKRVKANPLTAHIPFIFFTAKSEKTDIQAGIKNGASGYIVKPFDAEELINTVKYFLEPELRK